MAIARPLQLAASLKSCRLFEHSKFNAFTNENDSVRHKIILSTSGIVIEVLRLNDSFLL